MTYMIYICTHRYKYNNRLLYNHVSVLYILFYIIYILCIIVGTEIINVYLYEVCPGQVEPLLYSDKGVCNIHGTWQPRRVDWNAHV